MDEKVSKDQLFEQADILTIHLVLSSRARGLVGAAELERMKPTAWLINASRGPIVEEQALVSVLKNKQIAGAAIDVFDVEPLPPNHPFRTLDNALATPHVAYGTQGLVEHFLDHVLVAVQPKTNRGRFIGDPPRIGLHLHSHSYPFSRKPLLHAKSRSRDNVSTPQQKIYTHRVNSWRGETR
jgi:phosphoglycerate dehydrogenase-like enzyme